MEQRYSDHCALHAVLHSMLPLVLMIRKNAPCQAISVFVRIAVKS